MIRIVVLFLPLNREETAGGLSGILAGGCDQDEQNRGGNDFGGLRERILSGHSLDCGVPSLVSLPSQIRRVYWVVGLHMLCLKIDGTVLELLTWYSKSTLQLFYFYRS
ncbi:hypothetical protein F0562_034610 [Nyssa sinensis]|uniref:Uncharacterized protein n=1 Tax=Nyssa sinensis TaxID=561372 RepID=A0A5J5A8N7_9ASTE|nr:hypothetical protein F0562_034610 [Nyssa sinensis]